MDKRFFRQLIIVIGLVMVILLVLNVFLMTHLERKSMAQEAELFLGQVQQVLDENEKELENLTDTVKQDYIMRAEAAAYMVENDPEIEDDKVALLHVANLLQVDEVHLFSLDGVIYSGTVPKYYGYSLDSGEQIAFFKPMLEDTNLTLCQDLTPNTAEAKPMMYAMAWRRDGEGLVQIGVEPKRLMEESEKNELSYLFGHMTAPSESVMYAIDRESGQVLGATDEAYNGKTMEALGLKLPEDPSDWDGFKATVAEKPSYCIFREYKDYYIGISQDMDIVHKDVQPNMAVVFIYLFIAAALLVYAIYYYSEKDMQRELQQQKELAKALEKAEAANKAKTNFLFNMSHDIRTPMNAILGFTAIAQKHVDDRERVLDSLEKLNHAGQHLLRLISDVLDMARIESGKTELNVQPCSFTSMLANVKDLFAMEMEKKGLEFSVSWDIQDDIIYVDRLKMEQIELNLISNALKYTPSGGKVTYTVSQMGPVKDGYAAYEAVLQDTGIGMNKEFCAHVFEAFEREKNASTEGIQGTGLGLAITKKIIDQMGGSISCESEPGVGTTFRFNISFKIGEEKDLADEIKENALEDIDFTGKRILLAEDNELNREIAMEILCEYGFLVESAEDGIVAVEKISQSDPGYYDLVLMDIQMPNMDGYKATHVIRELQDEALANIPIIAMTANAFDEDRQNAIDAGMNGHLAKPIDMGKLAEALQQIFG